MMRVYPEEERYRLTREFLKLRESHGSTRAAKKLGVAAGTLYTWIGRGYGNGSSTTKVSELGLVATKHAQRAEAVVCPHCGGVSVL